MMLTSAVVFVFVFVVAAIYASYGRSLWAATYTALLLVAAALFCWDLLPIADRAAKNAIVLAVFTAVALLLVNLVLARRSGGWTR